MIKQHGFTDVLLYQYMYSKSCVQIQSGQSDFSYLTKDALEFYSVLVLTVTQN